MINLNFLRESWSKTMLAKFNHKNTQINLKWLVSFLICLAVFPLFNANANSCDGDIRAFRIIPYNGDGSDFIKVRDGDTFCTSDFANDIRITARVAGSHESLVFEINGAIHARNTENHLPYDSPQFWANPGTYTINAKLYSQGDGKGNLCDEHSITFTVKDCAPPPSCGAKAAHISGGPYSFCVGDGAEDRVGNIDVSGGAGYHALWLVTDEHLNILATPAWASDVDFDGAGVGTCLLWYLTFDHVEGAAVGSNVNYFTGCFELSNSIRIERNECAPACGAKAAHISGGPYSFCVGDGAEDRVGNIDVSGGAGYHALWLVTDEHLNILATPAWASDVDFDGAGVGTCLLWYLTFDHVEGAAVGSNVNFFTGCFELSNSIRIERNECAPSCGATAAHISGGPYSFCVGDGAEDRVGNIDVRGGSGAHALWLVTDEQLNILGTPAWASDVDFDGAGVGTCLLWYLTFDHVEGAAVGSNVNFFTGCFELSNSIRIERNECAPSCGATAAHISGGPYSFCVGDGAEDRVGNIDVSGGAGYHALWLVTDEHLNILATPAWASDVDFDGAGVGTCLLWYLTFDHVEGAAVGSNVNFFTGCFELSNSIRIERNECQKPTNCDGDIRAFRIIPYNGDGSEYTKVRNGDTFCSSDFPADVRITARVAGSHESLLFDISGAVHSKNSENHLPYDSRQFWLNPGKYTINAKLFSENNGRGTQCDEHTITFTIRDCRHRLGNEDNYAINVYPNPASNQIEIKLLGDGEADNVSVYNVSGQIVLEQNSINYDGNVYKANVSHLKEGLYFVKTIKGDSVQTGQFLIK